MQATRIYASPNGSQFLFTAVPIGAAGNGITVQILPNFLGPAYANLPLLVTVVGQFVKIQLQTDATGANVLTNATAFIAAVAGSVAASALVTVTIFSGTGATIVFSYGGGVQSLSGGTGAALNAAVLGFGSGLNVLSYAGFPVSLPDPEIMCRFENPPDHDPHMKCPK